MCEHEELNAMTETHHASAASPFTDAEIRYFHAEDLAAGKAVVSLMVGIFTVGVVLYTIVAVAIAT
jgi:hypothetical protein